MINRFTGRAQQALNGALREASSLGHTYIGSEHLLLGLLSSEGSVAFRILATSGIERQAVRNAVTALSGEGGGSRVHASDMTPRARAIIRDAAGIAKKAELSFIGSEHLLLSILETGDCVAVRMLDAVGGDVDGLLREVEAFVFPQAQRTDPSDKLSDKMITGRDTEDLRSMPERESSSTREERRRSVEKGHVSMKNNEETLKATPTLAKYGRDLTARAADGAMDPVIGRDKETERVIQILSRRQKNNPCLIGEPGVGKTAVVEGLAERIAEGHVPDTLTAKKLVTLDIPSMIAGAKYRGEFEERLKSVMQETREHRDIILFIDEMHTIVGAGAAEGAVDTANILKPALARGELQIIGATTIEEYRRYIEKDAALERRFQSVIVEEPSAQECIRILQGLRERYELHHGLLVSDEAIEAAVNLSIRYIPDRYLPDKALDLMDEAASRRRMQVVSVPPDLRIMEAALEALAHEKEEAIRKQDFEAAARLRDEEAERRNDYETARAQWVRGEGQEKEEGTLTVTAEDVAAVVTSWTTIPVARLMEEEGARLLHLEDQLSQTVKGQQTAIRAVAGAIRRGRLGLKDPRRPIGSFLFAGPSGVGKTSLSRALATALFGDERALIRFDMSEYMEKHSISRLIGSPPGYVGHEEGGQLTEKLRRHPYAVILFDELERAHPDIADILLQILEDGILTDALGRQVSFTNTVIIMTTNAGTHEGGRLVGFSGMDTNTEAELRIREGVKKTFREELLNRIDEIVVFSPLGEEELRQIATAQLDACCERASRLGIHLHVSDELITHMVKTTVNGSGNARKIRRAVVHLIEDPLSNLLLSGEIKAGMRLEAVFDGVTVQFIPYTDDGVFKS